MDNGTDTWVIVLAARVRSRTARTKVALFLAAFLVSLAGYPISLYLLLYLLLSPAEVDREAPTAFIIRFWVTVAVHLIVSLAGSALVARRLRAPVLPTMAATASAIVVSWLGLALLSSQW